MDASRKIASALVAAVLVLVLITLIVAVASSAFPFPGWGMGPGMMGRVMGPGAFSPPVAPTPAPTNTGSAWPATLLWVLILVLLAAMISLAWLLTSSNRRAAKRIEKRETPLEIAKRRYVAGEITFAEYEEMLKTLTKNGEALEMLEKPGNDRPANRQG